MATKETKGPVIIGDNITVIDGTISITAEDIINALNYCPALAGNTQNSAYSADKLTTKQVIQGVEFDGTNNVYNYAICSTPAEEAIKVIELPNFSPIFGAELIITFINGNTNENPVLQINDETITYPLIHQSEPFINIKVNYTYHFILNSDNFQLISESNIILGVKGENNLEYKTGLVELNKNDIGLGQVDNTADSIKSVHDAIYAIKDQFGNDIDFYYFTKDDSQKLNTTINENKELENTHYLELIDKYKTTNDTLADLHTDVVNNTNHIDEHNKLLITVNTNNILINQKIDENNRKIDDVYEEISTIHEDITSTHDVAQEGLNTASKAISALINTDNKLLSAESNINYALELIEQIDNIAEIAEKDKNGKVIDETYATIDSPLFTGNPRYDNTVSIDDNSNTLATTSFVHQLINSTLGINTEVLDSLVQITNLLEDNSSLPDGIMNLIISKQDRSVALTNFLDKANNSITNQIIYSTGYGTFDTININNSIKNYLNTPDPASFRTAIDALGKSEKAISAVNADTATNCIGNAASANYLYVSREISTTDGTNKSEFVKFDGKDNIAIPLPKKIIADIEGTSAFASSLKNAKNIQVDLASNEKQLFDNTTDISPGVKGILSVKNGGTGTDSLDKVIIGLSKKIENRVNEATDILFTQFDDEYARIHIDKKDNIGVLEIATADKANEPIVVRQYYGRFNTIERTFTLLDEEGNTNIPGQLTVNSLVLPTKKPDNLIHGSIWIE